MRFNQLLTEIRELPVDRYDTGMSWQDPNDRRDKNQIRLGSYNGYSVWTKDLRMQGETNHEWDIEVTTRLAPYTVVIRMDLSPYIMQGEGGQEVNGSKVDLIQKVPDGVGSDINMVDFYIWIMKTLGTAMISDSKQSKGGASIWKRLASDPRVNVYGYSPATSEFSQVDDEGDADKWDTWQELDQDVIDQAKSARKSAGYVTVDDAFEKIKLALDSGKMSSDDAIKRMKEVKTIENEIRKEANDARKVNSEAIHHMLFAVPSNRSIHK
tara:strand:- start:68 stop:871 length:804 start_codon:yes stop_codon:yes gene_type:complete